MRYALLSVLIFGNGCSFMQARSDFREEKRMRTSLMEGAEAYWDSMRWSDIASAAGYYQDPQVRVNWLTYMGSGGATQYRSATILRIELGPELEEHERIVMFMAIGYPDPDGGVPHSEKRPLDGIRSWNRS